MKITKDMSIGEILEKYPHLAKILVENGLQCINCSARFSETLEHGLKKHDMDDKKVNEVIKKLNENADKIPEIKGKLITITERAAKKLKEILKQEDKEDYGLRIQVNLTESGYEFGLDFEKETNKDDEVVEEQGIKLFIAKESISLVSGAKIDHKDNNFHISKGN